MNKENVACIIVVILIISSTTIVVFQSIDANRENYYDLNVSTENKVLFKMGSINAWGNMVWESDWRELPLDRSCFKPTDYGIKFKEYVYTGGIYEIVYSDGFYFNYNSLADNDNVAHIVLENATITIVIV
jgi:hypothetical protein